jgi:hypothetical protein
VRQNLGHSKSTYFQNYNSQVMIVSLLFLEMVVEPLFLSLNGHCLWYSSETMKLRQLVLPCTKQQDVVCWSVQDNLPLPPLPFPLKTLRGKNRTTRKQLWSNLRAQRTFEQDNGWGGLSGLVKQTDCWSPCALVWEDCFPYLILKRNEVCYCNDVPW